MPDGDLRKFGEVDDEDPNNNVVMNSIKLFNEIVQDSLELPCTTFFTLKKDEDVQNPTKI